MVKILQITFSNGFSLKKITVCLSVCLSVFLSLCLCVTFTPFYPSALRAGRVLTSRSGRVGGCQTFGTHISVTAWWIFSIWSSVQLSRPVVHWNENVVILMKFSSLAALEVVIWATSGAASVENFVKMTTFSFQCCALSWSFAPPGWRGIVVTVRAGGQPGGRLPNLRNPYLCNRLMDFLHSKFCGIV